MKRIFTFLMLITCFSFAGFGQTWVSEQGPYSGSIQDIVVHPTSSNIYILTGSKNPENGGSIYRSTDDGGTWAIQTSSVFVTGQNQTDANQLTDINLLSDGTLFAISSNVLYKSTDDGSTWAKVNGAGSSATGFDKAIEVTKNPVTGTLYVSGSNTTNFKYTIFRSTNGGSTFTNGFGDLNGNIKQITFASNGDVYAIQAGKILKSTDDGVSFTSSSSPDLFNVVALTSKSDNSQLLMMSSGSTIYSLSPPFASASWTFLTETGIDAADISNYASSQNPIIGYSRDNSTIFLPDNQNNKFYTSTTLGTWTKRNSTLVTSNGEDITCIASKSASTIYGGLNTIGFWKSTNSGVGWSESNKGFTNSNFNNIVVADNGNIVVAGDRAFTTNDQGVTWSRVSNILNQGYYAFKALTGSPRPIVLLGQNSQPSYRSTDNGVSWTVTAAATPSNANNFYSPDGTKILGYGQGSNPAFYYTSNQGTSWSTAINTSNITGASWPVGNYSFNSTAAMDPNGVIYIFLYDQTANSNKLLKIALNSSTAPTGGTATLLSMPSGVTSVNYSGGLQCLNGVVYLAEGGGGGKTYSSSNSGSTWTATTLPQGYRLDVDPINNYVFSTHYNGSTTFVAISRDAGATFTQSTLILNGQSNPFAYGYAVSSSGIAYAGVGNSNVYNTLGTIVTPPPPTSLISSGTATDRVTLRWIDNSTNEDRFIVEKFNGASYDSIGYKSSNSTTGAKVYYEVRNLLANTSYTFRISAKNAAGISSTSNVTLSTLNQCASTIPDNRSWNGSVAASGTPSSATLTNVTIKSLGNGFFSITDVVNGTIATYTTVPSVFVEACGSTYSSPGNTPLQPNSNGSWNGTTLTIKWITTTSISPEITGTATLIVNGSDPLPAAPSSPSAYVYNNSGIEVSWLGSAFETQFIVERSTVNTFATIDRTITVFYPATSVVDNIGLVNNTTYFYRVKGKNSAGTSAPSSTFATIAFTKPYFTLSGTIIESTTSYSTTGAIWGDFNNDGFDDLIMPELTFFNNVPAVPLAYKNDGAGNFVSVTPTGIVPALYLAASAADYDNDGNLDLFLTADGTQNFLYKGNGDLTFTLISSTPVSGNYFNITTQIIDLGASWVDYNKDGLVDLFVTTNNNSASTKSSTLYTQGPVGTFTKVASGSIASVIVQGSLSIWADYDNDGDQDVFITDQNNPTGVNQLFKNNNDGTFTRVTGAPFDTDAGFKSFTAAWGDYNNDTFFDLFVGAAGGNFLYKNNGNGTFTKQNMTTTVNEPLNTNIQAFGASWGDVNNDGFIDLLVTNVNGESLFYINNNGTAFTKVSNEKFNDIKVNKFGAGFSDYNRDGLLDLATGVVDPTIFGGGFSSGPGIKSQLFKNNSSSAGNWIELRLKGTVSNKTAIGTRITLVAGGKTQIREVVSTSTFCGQPGQVIHFGLGSSASITSIQIKWPSGIIQTLTAPSTNQLLVITEDNTPPQVTLFNPLNNAQNVAVNTPIEITFDEAFVAVAGKKVNVFIQGSGSPEFSLNATAGTIVGNKISFTPPAALGFLNIYVVQVDAGAFTDIYGNATPAISWTFVTLDNIAPTLTFTPPALDYKFISTQFAVTAADNSGTVSSATLSYRKIAGGSFTDLPGTFDATNSVWNFTVQESFFDGNGLEFFLTAKDPANNIGRLPLDPNTNFYSYLNYKAADNVIPSAQLGFGGTAGGWKIFTIPFDYGSNNGVSTVFSQLNSLPTDNTAWRMLTYKDKTAWAEYPSDFSTFNRGQGYFINIKTPVSLKIPDATVSANNRKTLYQMALKKGWNQVGNPYLTPINWSDVTTLNTLSGTAAQLKTFASGNYTNATSLQAFEGGFVLADNDATISIPFSGQTAVGGRQEKLPFGDNDWLMPLTLKNGDIENNFGGVGMHTQALFSFDQFDDINAPRFINYLEMNFAHPEFFAKQFARDVVPTQSEYQWQFTFDGNMAGATQMTWDNANLGANTKEIFLYDIGREIVMNMREQSSYSIDPKKATLFRIYYGENLKDKIKPDNISLGEAYPNPSRGNVTIPFTLPENHSRYQVALEVYNAMGQKVSTLADDFYTPGFYSSRWETSQTTLSNGLYIYRIKVSDQNRSVILSGKIVINQ